MIVGRDGELRQLRDFADRLRAYGQPLLVSGEVGVGKTVLLDKTARYASAQGYRVVRAAGVEFEAEVSFAALHLVLQPLFGELGDLDQWHREALMTALGLREGPRQAILHRSGGHCEWAGGCWRPAAACHIHHIIRKADGGKTSVKDCLLLCSFHHLVAVHRWGWKLILNLDGTTTAYSPDGSKVLHSHGPPPRPG